MSRTTSLRVAIVCCFGFIVVGLRISAQEREKPAGKPLN